MLVLPGVDRLLGRLVPSPTQACTPSPRPDSVAVTPASVPVQSNAADAPEDHESLQHSGGVSAERRRRLRQPERVVGHALKRPKLHLGADLLLRNRVRGVEPRLPQILDFRIVGPAEPGPLAVAA